MRIMRNWFQLLTVVAAAERERWPLWSPVFLGLGIGCYFALPSEPPAGLGAVSIVVLLMLCLRCRRRPKTVLALLAALLFAAGFGAAQLRAALVAEPVLSRAYGAGSIAGHVVAVESLPAGPRVMLEDVELRDYPPEQTPARVRVVLRRGDVVAVGDRIELYGRLFPPRPPVAPGAYDFQRRAWFAGLGATGFAYTPARQVAGAGEGAGGIASRLRLYVAASRQAVTRRIRASLPGESGAVAAALMTGDRSAISGRTLDAMRDSGLAHLLAISGLHLGLVAAIVFFGVRTGFALSENLALRHPIKKWAAGAAIAGGLFYMLLAGATVPTQRAFLMTGLVLLAIIVDREAISMRLVAWAATLVLLLAPESLLGASFQMSFAAVVALVAFYEAMRRRRRLAGLRDRVGGSRILLYVVGVALTTVIASTATGVIALHHFGRIAVYGLPANLVAVPLTALWIMPWAVVSAVLMPLGLEAWGLAPMGWGIDMLLRVAGGVSGWPGAVVPVRAMPVAGLVAAVFGGLWLCLWQTRWRHAGMAGVVAGIATIAVTPGPDILVSDNGRLFAVRLADGTLSLSTGRRERYAADIWLEDNAQAERAYWPVLGPTDDNRLSCDPLGCVYRSKGRTAALVTDGRALSEECAAGDTLISAVPVRGYCAGPRLVIDRFDLWRHGAHALWLGENGTTRVETVRGKQGRRPWVPRRGYETRSNANRRPGRAPLNTGASARSAGPEP